MRKRRAVKRDVLADPIYNSKLVTRLINKMMVDGKRGIAQSTLYEAFAKVEEKTGKPANEVKIERIPARIDADTTATQSTSLKN